MMQETRDQQIYGDPTTQPQTPGLRGGTAIHLGLSHLLTCMATLGLQAWLAYLHIQPLSMLPLILAGAVGCGFLCTLPFQHNLSRLALALAHLAHDRLHTTSDQYSRPLPFMHPLGPLFLYTQAIEQRLRRTLTNERLTTSVREQALQQAREAAALAERNRIARELHDSIKQQIFGISASAAAAQAYWQQENLEGAREAVEDIQHNTQGAQVEMQALLQQLRPAPLEHTSLLEALYIQAQALGFRTGACVQMDLVALPANDRLLPGTPETIFRLVQEAFANTARHARARKVWLAVHTIEQEIRITVRDDGQGFDPARVRSGMGLTNLHERTRALQGSVEVSSQPGQGTTVLMIIPLLEALRSPAEEDRQRCELARTEEMARNEYRRCTNACFLSVALGLIGLINVWDTFFSLDVLATLLVGIYGYVCGMHYSARVAASAGRESRAALELAQEHYRASLGLLLPITLGIWHILKLVTPLGAAPAPWLMMGLALCLLGLIQYSLRRDAQVSQRALSLLSIQDMSQELEKHYQAFNRSFMIWAVAITTGLLVNHPLFVFPPTTAAQQDAYGLALILLLIGLSHALNRQHIRWWTQQLRQRTTDQSMQAEEAEHG